MTDQQNNTIYALATPKGRSGVAIIRVSGSHALESLRGLMSDTNFAPTPRMALLVNLTYQNKLLDKAVVIYFKAPNSFTGEEVVEYHLHGSPAVIAEICAYFSKCPGHFPAQRGEFTRRGFENGRMDLTEAEAIADLIDAETSAQKDQALSQLSGRLRDLYEGWAQALTRALAHLEADLDFPDEDMPEGVAEQVFPKITEIRDEILAHLNDGRRGERLRDGIKIAVIGAPNTGKSSLVNALAAREIAITSDLAGTTRDVLEAHLDIGGYPVILSDTAGLKPELLRPDVSRETGTLSAHDKIEEEGIRRAVKVAEEADIKLLVFDVTQEPDIATLALKNDNSLIIGNKSDLIPAEKVKNDYILISRLTETGIGALLEALKTKITAIIGQNTAPPLTRERHRHHLQECTDSLNAALSASGNGGTHGLPELITEDLRLAVRALGHITGRVTPEDLLDVIFSEFCIGK